jgi:ADP-sugar diphosphatase
VDRFGSRIGFIKFEAEVRNSKDERPFRGVVFLRGGSVALLVILRAEGDDTNERWVVMTKQPRIPAGSLDFFEIPAGMIDDEGNFAGAAARELFEETDLKAPMYELQDMTAMALERAVAPEAHL